MWWIKWKWGNQVLALVDIVRNLGKIEELNTQRNKRENRLWIPLGSGCIKVNVNGSFLTNSGSGKLGDTFCDTLGKILLKFAK